MNEPSEFMKGIMENMYQLKWLYDHLSTKAPLWLRICIYIAGNHIEDYSDTYLLEVKENA